MAQECVQNDPGGQEIQKVRNGDPLLESLHGSFDSCSPFLSSALLATLGHLIQQHHKFVASEDG